MKHIKSVWIILFCLLLSVQNIDAAGSTGGWIASEESGIEQPDETQEERAENEIIGPEISAPSAILMEASTGQVIYEKDANTARPPASVTKVMTMLLIFDAIESGKIRLEDEVSTSELAASMGGSQVFLEPGETQTVDTMLKCIAVSSANDACVAMAEYISGSVEAFVEQMNQKAKELGMENTHFVNCNGLDADGHVISARDIAVMSRELITKHPQIHDYCMIWMENITHNTSKGSSEFGLSNTNKLVRQYEYTTGLKTGSTGNAKFCVSATAEKNGVELIAVIMGAENSKERFKDAVALLNMGFGKCQVYKDENPPKLKQIEVKDGVKENVLAEYEENFSYLDLTGGNLSEIQSKVTYEKVKAPVKKGDQIGALVYSWNGNEIGRIPILASESVEKAGYADYILKILDRLCV